MAGIRGGDATTRWAFVFPCRAFDVTSCSFDNNSFGHVSGNSLCGDLA
jgi:hypothetical protein